ncbi:Pantoate--beta-alanine ligase [Bathymodiolus thermophilus thioautotrophic gill symbiont]|jgi:pantoate--beta-alanine ligase|uniref:Pantothenate synthetase n=1 Tax=Bathymodiolus thermophilus thioautotrophic gill symbiont TaxID=2360 RepID=A0A3G3IML2_9GAMM|nr:pantoate--beta-alanine ligase [Bathymodiolus thermophilus thioautotrophic gill symbiont]AYQ57087.1 Pantothenate synthetase [Bathymodiolus thermophilus thioautotrophic gill symbiont]SGZ59138.1 Pantoate--beta-alanine ligase [Bathymodiolus thermophilus thioautotrophic gill symbiont]
MEIISDINVMEKWRNEGEKVAFVPTMGGLHQGHLSLIDLARENADRVVVSIFVNPTQFGENEDFADYPRTLDSDLKLLEKHQVDCAFVPNVEVIYPDKVVFTRAGFEEKRYLFETLCGKTRPHFFYGVLQVVRRLFEIVRPDVAVFGQKDYQQLQIIKRFTSGVKVITGVIVREEDGLAMSTRNQYLNMDERLIAPNLYKILRQLQRGELGIKSATEQLQSDFELDYLAMLDANTLKQITDNTSKIAILCAVFLGSTRLLDNIIFTK